jgi:hypothetical protein
MPEQDPRAAMRGRDSGLRKVRQLTWRAGAAGLAFSAIVIGALAHHASASAAPQQPSAPAQQTTGQPATGQQSPGTQPKPHGHHHHAQKQSQLVIPAQPPKPSSGGGHTTSGAS